jgi:hypothetical protein
LPFPLVTTSDIFDLYFYLSKTVDQADELFPGTPGQDWWAQGWWVGDGEVEQKWSQ